jgi:hypothetical protein
MTANMAAPYHFAQPAGFSGLACRLGASPLIPPFDHGPVAYGNAAGSIIGGRATALTSFRTGKR